VEKKRRKNGLLEEQEKFVNFWSSSLPAPLVGGLDEYILFSLYQGLVVDRRRH